MAKHREELFQARPADRKPGRRGGTGYTRRHPANPPGEPEGPVVSAIAGILGIWCTAAGVGRSPDPEDAIPKGELECQPGPPHRCNRADATRVHNDRAAPPGPGARQAGRRPGAPETRGPNPGHPYGRDRPPDTVGAP
ncbi:hypothetical protein GCM10010341_25010 [Streptomyces noursei]|nr:hypothetical protein GCM10010341_25010 [Streptomyces noursei]